MNTPTIGSIRPVPGQRGDHVSDQEAARGPLSRLRGARSIESSWQPPPAVLPASSAHPPLHGGAELLLNFAVRPAHAAVAPHGSRALDKILNGTLALLASLPHAEADPAVAQALRVLQEHAALRALALDYRSALQAG